MSNNTIIMNYSNEWLSCGNQGQININANQSGLAFYECGQESRVNQTAGISSTQTSNTSEWLSCGNQGQININANQSVLAFYVCGQESKVDPTTGRSLTQTSGASRRVSTKTFGLLLWLCFFTFATGTLAAPASLYTVAQYDGNDYAVVNGTNNYDLVLKAHEETGLPVFSVDENLMYSNFELPEATDSLVRRDNDDAIYTTFKQYNITDEGTTTGPWYPVTPCFWADAEHLGGSQALNYSQTYSWSSESKSLKWEDISPLVKNGTVSISSNSTMTCLSNGSDVVQIWVQQRLHWFDTRVQECRKQKKGGAVFCQAWSEPFRSYAPIEGNESSGCSSGMENTYCF